MAQNKSCRSKAC